MAMLKLCVGFGLFLHVGAFNVYDAEYLNSKYKIGEACVQALSADIACHQRVSSFLHPNLRGPLEDVALTDAVCSNTCSQSLRDWFETAAKDCKGEKFGVTNGDILPSQYGGYLWAGWNETCLKDEETNRYCSDILHEFPNFDSHYEMPHEQLCHPCYGRLLAIRQSSRYSTYNFGSKQHLEYVYETCGGSGPTDVLSPPEEEEEEPAEPFCLTQKYHITEDGDTCDSISKDAGISGAFLYMGNRELITDCLHIPAGLKLCLPMPCKTHYVLPGETCFSIGQSPGIGWETIQFYNSWVNRDCKNLQTATDFYGKSVCIGPLGDSETIAQVQEPSKIHRKVSSGNGPTYYWRMPLPEGSEAAKGTTSKCSKWHVVAKSDTCASICNEYSICSSRLMWDMNPSLDSTFCDTSLVPGVALCVTPMSIWSKEDKSEQDRPKEDESNDNEPKDDEVWEDLRK
ncbi:hypothetical protein FSARC_250 [Fusarium sarcochroum]|uniref:LysM domain-containing protein n=1 Tax=Fusarium sarcochroum TaxID=1208366 RepID=A0A8H4UBM3_9HYPO|nr:hypothetical protein FSARC_250 [Fusarium sarcochroum]